MPYERSDRAPATLDVRFRVVSPWFRPEYLPRYRSDGAAGMDLHACLESPVELAPGSRRRIPTGVAIQLTRRDAVALVYARSGLAWRQGVSLPNGVGVIDSDYTGELEVLLTNFSDRSVTISPGDRIAQLVVAPIYVVRLLEVDRFEPTGRGTGGFGSTGVRA
ncbi:MAG: dUTP diphosphatase [Alicyclobacillaceae bacterium]|nr:dUTP diphosphatase [Alicyclobacillaceae bacterium]